MHHLQRSGRMLARLHLAVNRSFCPPKMPKPQRDPTLASISVAILCREIALYILLKPKLLAKDLKPLRAAVFIVFKDNKVWLLYHIPYGIDAYNSVIAPGGN